MMLKNRGLRKSQTPVSSIGHPYAALVYLLRCTIKLAEFNFMEVEKVIRGGIHALRIF